MRTFFAIQNDTFINSGWQQCLTWARQQIKKDNSSIQLLSARGGENDALVIAEITREYERIIKGERRISIKGFKNGQA